MLSIPFFAFWVLLFVGRDELGLKGIAIAIVVWFAVSGLFSVLPIPGSLLVTAQAVIDIVLVLIIFKGDVRLT